MVTVCKFFLLFFNLLLFSPRGSSEKTNNKIFCFLAHERRRRRKRKKILWNLHFYNIQSHNTHTQNVYRAIRIYDCGKCSIFRVAIFVLLARFNVRIFVRRGVRAADRFWREKFCLLYNLFSVVEKKKEDRLPFARDKIVNAESASQWFEDAHEREKRA